MPKYSIRPLLTKVNSSAFARNVAAMSVGEIVAMLLPILVAPIIGRLYSPTEYGPLAAYMAFSTIGGSLAILQFDRAIVAEVQSRAIPNLVALCLVILAVIVSASVLVSISLFFLLGNETQLESLRFWILALPFSIAMVGVAMIAREVAVREAYFKTLARYKVVTVSIAVAMQIMLGFAGWQSSGLIVAYLLSQIASAVLLLWLLFGVIKFRFRDHSRYRFLILIRRHKGFTLFTLPSRLLNEVLQQTPIFALTAIGAADALGAFARARQLIFLPLALVGQAIASVFRSHAMSLARRTGSFHSLFVRIMIVSFLISLPGFLIVAFLAPPIFAFYLGPEWRIAGEIAQLISPLLVLRMVAAPLGSIYNLTGHQKNVFQQCLVATIVGVVGAFALVANRQSEDLIFISYLISYGGFCVSSIYFSFAISKNFTVSVRSNFSES